jgi:hypothetical protein
METKDSLPCTQESKGRTSTVGIREQGVEENTWNEEEQSNARSEKTT